MIDAFDVLGLEPPPEDADAEGDAVDDVLEELTEGELGEDEDPQAASPETPRTVAATATATLLVRFMACLSFGEEALLECVRSQPRQCGDRVNVPGGWR
jgi:hypothetical protein